MIDLSIKTPWDALAACFFFVVLPAFFLLSFASAFMIEFERKGNWREVKRDIWKFNPDIFQESLYDIGFLALFLTFGFSTRFAVPLALLCGLLTAFLVAGILTFIGRLFLCFVVFCLERKHPNGKN